jgi:hypothetical protein
LKEVIETLRPDKVCFVTTKPEADSPMMLRAVAPSLAAAAVALSTWALPLV